MNQFTSGSPVVDRTEERFVEHFTVAGERRRVEFTKPIIWLQESETKLQYMHGGKLLKEGATYNDWYGYLTSIHQSTEEAVKFAKHFSIDQRSSLELVLVTTVSHHPATESEETIAENRKKPANYKSTYLYVPDSWRQEAMEDGEKIYPTLKPRTLHEGAVWSSRNAIAENEDLAARFREQWKLATPAT